MKKSLESPGYSSPPTCWINSYRQEHKKILLWRVMLIAAIALLADYLYTQNIWGKIVPKITANDLVVYGVASMFVGLVTYGFKPNAKWIICTSTIFMLVGLTTRVLFGH